MFSISRFLGHDEKFYDLLEASAQQADSSVHHLIDLLAKLEKSESASDLAAFAESRREDKRITQELTEELSKTFITPLEREDIQALAAALYKIPKTVEKIGERILICPEDLHGHNFRRQVELLDQAAEVVVAMVQQLRKGTDIRTAREMNTRLQTIEGDADKLELELLRDLYHVFWFSLAMLFFIGAFDSVSVIIRGTIVQLVTPDEMRGRVSAVNNIFIGTSNEFGALESGITAALFGPVISVVGGGIGTILVVLGVAKWWPETRRIGRLDKTLR